MLFRAPDLYPGKYTCIDTFVMIQLMIYQIKHIDLQNDEDVY